MKASTQPKSATFKKPTAAWGWQKPNGSFWPEAFPVKSDAVQFFGENEYSGSLARVFIVPYKKK